MEVVFVILDHLRFEILDFQIIAISLKFQLVQKVDILIHPSFCTLLILVINLHDS
jgi:hypothetical protein